MVELKKLTHLVETLKKDETKKELGDELETLIAQLLTKVESKQEDEIKDAEEEIQEFLEDHELQTHTEGRKNELDSLKKQVTTSKTSANETETKNEHPETSSRNRKTFRKRTGIAAAVAGLTFFATKAFAGKKEVPGLDKQKEGKVQKGKFQLPYEQGKSFPITSHFHDSREYGEHKALDIAMPVGTPLRAIGPGKVKEITNSSRGGNILVIEHTNGTISKYMHLSEINVNKGQAITADQIIAESGKTGNCTGPHLHLEIRKDGEKVDPLAMIDFDRSSSRLA